LNIVAGREVLVYEDAMGNLSLDVPDPVPGSEVSDSQSSMTKIPNYYVTANSKLILCDFPGFGDNRGGQMQLLQYLLMQNIVAKRKHKFVLVKSALTKRDQSFIELANQAFLTHSNTVAVVSHATVRAPKEIGRYTDEQVTKKIVVCPLLAPYFHSETFEIVAHDYQVWAKEFLCRIDGLEVYQGDIDMPQTSEMFRYISLWKERLLREIQVMIDQYLKEKLHDLIIEPHNLDFLSGMWDSEVTLRTALESLMEARIIGSVPENMQTALHSWELFERLGQAPEKGTLNKKWSFDSVNEILFFRDRIELQRKEDLWTKSGTTEEKLDTWTRKVHSHWIKYSSIKTTICYLLNHGKPSIWDKKEISRIFSFRKSEIARMLTEMQKLTKECILFLMNPDVLKGNPTALKKQKLHLSDTFFRKELEIWNKLSVDNLAEFPLVFHEIENLVAEAVNGLKEEIAPEEPTVVSKLIFDIKERNESLLQEISWRAHSNRGCHYHEHNLVEKETFKVTQFACCRNVFPKNFKILYCTFCDQYWHSVCFPYLRSVPCKTLNTASFSPFAVPFKFTTSSTFPDRNHSFRECISAIRQVYAADTPYLIQKMGHSNIIAIRGTENHETTFEHFFLEPIRCKPGSKELCDIVGGFNVMVEEMIQDLLDQIGEAPVIFTGVGIGGALAHCLNLRFYLKGHTNAASLAFGSPCTFGPDSVNYMNASAHANTFLTVVTDDDFVPGIMQHLAKGISAKNAFEQSDPTMNKIVTSKSFAVRFLTEKVKVLGRYVFCENQTILETNDTEVILEELEKRIPPQEAMQIDEDPLHYSKSYLDYEYSWIHK
jgi:hypothetical protein